MRWMFLVWGLVASTALAMPPQAPPVEVALLQAPPVEYDLKLPKGAERYEASAWTQAISVLNDRDHIAKVPVKGTRSKWHQSGGMDGIAGVTSEKYRTVPSKPREWIGTIQVWNGSNYQPNKGLIREYPDGTRFDDVLSYKGRVFEHRAREKEDGKWINDVIYADADARPPGYTGLKQTCASCHNRAGMGTPEADGRSTYANGLPPGGDTVISDPLPWHLVRGDVEALRQSTFEPREQFEPYIPQSSGRRRWRR